jgi:hypothetical protein
MSNALNGVVNALLWCSLPLCPFPLYHSLQSDEVPVKNGQVKLTGRQSADRNSEAIF